MFKPHPHRCHFIGGRSTASAVTVLYAVPVALRRPLSATVLVSNAPAMRLPLSLAVLFVLCQLPAPGYGLVAVGLHH
jgi:hypothetical protein